MADFKDLVKVWLKKCPRWFVMLFIILVLVSSFLNGTTDGINITVNINNLTYENISYPPNKP